MIFNIRACYMYILLVWDTKNKKIHWEEKGGEGEVAAEVFHRTGCCMWNIQVEHRGLTARFVMGMGISSGWYDSHLMDQNPVSTISLDTRFALNIYPNISLSTTRMVSTCMYGLAWELVSCRLSYGYGSSTNYYLHPGAVLVWCLCETQVYLCLHLCMTHG